MSNSSTTGTKPLRGSKGTTAKSVPRADAPARSLPLAGPLVLFMLGGGLGLLGSYDLRLSQLWLLWLVAGCALYIGTTVLVATPAALQVAAAVPVAVAASAALLLALQYRHLGFDEKFGFVAWLGARSSAPFPPLVPQPIDANAAASLMEGALPLALGLAYLAHRRMRLLCAGAALLLAYGLLLTASRGAWLALVAAALLAALGLLRKHVAWRRFALVGLLLALAVAMLLVLTPGGQRALDAVWLRAADRLVLYRNSLLLALDFPFSGIGAGQTFGMVYASFQLLIGVPYVGYAHNLLLAVWLAQGLLGLLGFVALVATSGRLIMRALWATGPRTTRGVLWGAAFGCLVLLLHGITDSPQYDTAWPSLLIGFMLLALAVNAARALNGLPLVWLRLGRRHWAGALLVAAVCALLAGPRLLALASANVAAVLEARAGLAPGLTPAARADLRQGAARWSARALALHADSVPGLKRSASQALASHDFARAVPALERALRHRPADQSIRKALGYAYIWEGRVAQGVALLHTLERRAEVRGELDVWPQAWRERGRADLAARAEQAAAAMP